MLVNIYISLTTKTGVLEGLEAVRSGSKSPFPPVELRVHPSCL